MVVPVPELVLDAIAPVPLIATIVEAIFEFVGDPGTVVAQEVLCQMVLHAFARTTWQMCGQTYIRQRQCQ